MDAATAAAYHASLARALDAGAAVLSKGGRSIDAVEAAIKVLEDDPLFNAGRGAAFDSLRQERDGCGDYGWRNVGSRFGRGVSATKNPIALARAVMEHSPYVMMVGPGADAFAMSQHLPQMPPSYFFTEMRWQELLGVLRAQRKPDPAATGRRSRCAACHGGIAWCGALCASLRNRWAQSRAMCMAT